VVLHRRTGRFEVCRHTCALGAAAVVIAVAGCGHNTPTPTEASGKVAGASRYALPEPKNWDFERAGIRGKVFPTNELTGHAGFLIIETKTGHETTIIEHESDFIYYIISGSGTFKIGETTVTCASGDLVVVPHSKKFTYKGQLRMLLVSTPVWSAEQEEVVS
jgi:mannose-6-phosphate isomerase-like protein (cupin superfamily)